MAPNECSGPDGFECCLPDPEDGLNVGQTVLAKAMEAEGTPCKSSRWIAAGL